VAGIFVGAVALWCCAVAPWRCGALAPWRCGAVALWRRGVADFCCGAVALWRCVVAMWRCGALAPWRREHNSVMAPQAPATMIDTFVGQIHLTDEFGGLDNVHHNCRFRHSLFIILIDGQARGRHP